MADIIRMIRNSRWAGLFVVLGLQVARSKADEFAWHEIEPTEHLQYHSCYEGYKCARLKVPLDWLEPNNTGTVAIAITTVPAVVPEDDPSHGGTIIINPGGPGGSGVMMARGWGRRLQSIVDRNKHYEILGFDPRGVLHTTPKADCFDSSALARDALLFQQRGLGSLDASKDGLRRSYAVTGAYGKLCEQTDQTQDILRYATTPSVARDMVEIVDRIEELRQKNKAGSAHFGTFEDQPSQQPMGSKKKDVARIQYLGFSYGTILGNTFASMFPGRVNRLVLDGVGDADDYMKGTWLSNLHDTDKIVDYFYSSCFEAGRKCPLNRKGDKSGKDIKQRVDKLISDADSSPIAHVSGSDVNFITGHDIRASFSRPIYQPYLTFQGQASLLDAALKGDYSMLSSNLELPSIQDACTIDNYTITLDDSQNAITCGDGEDTSGNDLSYYTDYIQRLKNQSETFGVLWATIQFTCSGWRVRPKWRFDGPFTTPRADPSLKEGVPAAPILLLSNELDPVTPLRNAYLMSAGHPGSAVVAQDGVGHCALGSGWSECTNEILRDYFEYGVVPKNNTKCHNVCSPWEDRPCGDAGAVAMNYPIPIPRLGSPTFGRSPLLWGAMY